MKKILILVAVVFIGAVLAGAADAKKVTKKKLSKKSVAAKTVKKPNAAKPAEKDYVVLSVLLPRLGGVTDESMMIKLSGFVGKWEGDPDVEIDERMFFGTTKRIPVRKGLLWRIGGYSDIATPTGGTATVRISGPFSTNASPVITADRKVDLLIEKIGEESGTF